MWPPLAPPPLSTVCCMNMNSIINQQQVIAQGCNSLLPWPAEAANVININTFCIRFNIKFTLHHLVPSPEILPHCSQTQLWFFFSLLTAELFRLTVRYFTRLLFWSMDYPCNRPAEHETTSHGQSNEREEKKFTYGHNVFTEIVNFRYWQRLDCHTLQGSE